MARKLPYGPAGMPAKQRRAAPYGESKISRVLHVGGISLQGLSKIAKQLCDDGQDRYSKRALAAINQEAWDIVACSVKLPMAAGGDFDWTFADPAKLLGVLVADSWELQEVFARAAARTPCSREAPWSVVLAFDEFTPGDSRKPKNDRKSMVCSFTFLELGADLLSEELAWTTPVVVRSCVIEKVTGQWSNMVKVLLKHMFQGTASMESVGIALELHGKPFLLFATLRALLSDNDGLRMALDVKGHAGRRPCISCYNLWDKGSPAENGAVDITCSDAGQFQPLEQSSLEEFVETIQEAHLRYQAGEMTKTNWENLQRALGINYSSNGLLMDIDFCRQMGILTSIRRDWMHGFLQHGIVEFELQAFLTTCQTRLGLTFDDWREAFRADWKFRRRIHSSMTQLYNKFNAYTKNWKLHADASAMLGICAILGHYVDKALSSQESIAAEVSSFLALCDAVGLALCLKRAPRDEMALLRFEDALKRHFDLHMLAYGADRIVPKHHYNLHVAGQVRQDKAVLDMFVIERHHRQVKRIAEHVKKTTRYEESVLKSLVTWQRNALYWSGETVLLAGLRGAVRDYGDSGWRVASAAFAAGRYVSISDVVVFGDDAGEVIACVEEHGEFYVVVECWTLVARHRQSGEYRRTDHIRTMRVESIVFAQGWYKDADVFTVLF